MSPEAIAAARKIIAAATPGPWESKRYNHFWHIYTTTKPPAERFDLIDEASDGDATFIAAARTGWGEALDEVDRLQTSVAKLNDARWQANAEIEKLRAVAEAAMEGHDHPPAPLCRLCNALKAAGMLK